MSSYFDQLPQMSNYMSGIMAFHKVTAEVCGEVIKEQIKASQSLMRSQSEHIQNLSHAKGLEEIMSLQAQFLQKLSPQMFEHGQHIVDCLLAGAGKYSKLMEEGYQQINRDLPVEKHKTQAHKERH